MKLYAKEVRVLREFINGTLSLRKTQEKLGYKSMVSVYIKAFHVLKAERQFNNNTSCTTTTK